MLSVFVLFTHYKKKFIAWSELGHLYKKIFSHKHKKKINLLGPCRDISIKTITTIKKYYDYKKNYSTTIKKIFSQL